MKRVRASITAGGAYIFGKFKGNGLLGITTEAEKILMLAALNLIECIPDRARQRAK
jgi:hypothetical protein